MRRLFAGLVLATSVLFASSSATLALRLSEPATPRRPSSVRTAGAPGPTQDAPAVDPAAADEAAGVTVLDFGAEPRRPLRLRLTPGTLTRTLVEMDLGLSIEVDGEPLDTPVPGTRLVVEHEVGEVRPDGRADVKVAFVEASVADGAGLSRADRQAVQSGLDQLTTVSGRGVIGVNGAVDDMSLDSSGVTDPLIGQMLDSLSQQVSGMAVPFPHQAVGLGARWSVGTTIRSLGLTTEATTTYTLRSRVGDDIGLDTVEVATVRTGIVELPGVPSDIEVSVERFETRSTGILARNLTRPVVDSGRQIGNAEGEFRLDDGRDAASMRQRISIDVVIGPA